MLRTGFVEGEQITRRGAGRNPENMLLGERQIPIEEFARSHDPRFPVAFKNQKVVIARDERIRVGVRGTSEDDFILGSRTRASLTSALPATSNASRTSRSRNRSIFSSVMW